MRITTLGAAAGFALLPAIMLAQTPTRDTTTTGTQPNPITGTNSGTTNAGTSTGTPPTTGTMSTQTNSSTTTNTGTTSTGNTNAGTTNSGTMSTGTMNSGTMNTGTTTTGSMNMGSLNGSSSSAGAAISSNGSMPATGSAFAMGTHSAARDSMVGPRPEPPGDGTTCPWGCPTSRGAAGLTGPQFLALQQELRDRKCGNSHVTGRLDAATRTAIRNCATKMGVANNAGAVLVGFDIGFSASDVGTSGNSPKQEE